jgi:hypothetical protein
MIADNALTCPYCGKKFVSVVTWSVLVGAVFLGIVIFAVILANKLANK